MGFDINGHFTKVLTEIGLSAADIGGRIAFSGADPIYDDVCRLGAISAIPTMACAAGTATIWRMRTGQGQDLNVDLRQSIHNLNPEYRFEPTLNGFPYSKAMQVGNPFIGVMFKTADGRHIMPAAVYQAQLLKWLNFLECQPSRESVAAAIGRWNGQELEDAATAQGLPISLCRTPEEWLQHPEGRYLAARPLIEIEKIADGAPRPFAPAKRPLSGIRVLAPVHAVAWPTVVRSFTEHGADALQISTPNDYEHDNIYNDSNIGMRSTWLDLANPEHNRQAHELAERADVFVENYRTSVMRRFGFTPRELVRDNPGLVYVSLKSYSYDGPWGERAGFDFQGSAASGLTVLEGTSDEPRMPATWMINDYITGYLGAAGALAALVRRAREGGSYHVKVSLARSAMWYGSLGVFDRTALDFSGEEHHLLPADTITRQTPLGELHRLAPPVRFSKTPGYWEDPILVPKGSSRPEWLETD